MTRTRWLGLFFLIAGMTGCIDPVDRRPGLWLSGEAAAAPGDWEFTDAYPEIAIEVATPYWIPHSVTIWCASVDGELFVGARDPANKRWPGWVDAEPGVRLGVAGQIYEAQLIPLDDAALLDRVRAAYRAKYDLPEPPPEGGPPVRYWRVEPS